MTFWQVKLKQAAQKIERALLLTPSVAQIIIESTGNKGSTWAVYKELTERKLLAFGLKSAAEAQIFADKQAAKWKIREKAGVVAPKYYIVREA